MLCIFWSAWFRVANGSSLFDNVTTQTPSTASETITDYCTCNGKPQCGGFAVSDNTSQAWEPNVVVQPKIPAAATATQSEAGVRQRRGVTDVVTVVPTDNVDFYYLFVLIVDVRRF